MFFLLFLISILSILTNGFMTITESPIYFQTSFNKILSLSLNHQHSSDEIPFVELINEDNFTSIIFSLKTDQNAKLHFTKYTTGKLSNCQIYELIIGYENTYSIFRKCRHSTKDQKFVETKDILSSREYKDFWVTWTINKRPKYNHYAPYFTFGYGLIPGISEILSYDIGEKLVSYKRHGIDKINFKSGSYFPADQRTFADWKIYNQSISTNNSLENMITKKAPFIKNGSLSKDEFSLSGCYGQAMLINLNSSSPFVILSISPSQYVSYMHCIWTVTSQENTTINVNFNFIDLGGDEDCVSSDSISLYAGPYISSSRIINKLCGNHYGIIQETRYSPITMWFRTMNNGRHHGFNVAFTMSSDLFENSKFNSSTIPCNNNRI